MKIVSDAATNSSLETALAQIPDLQTATFFSHHNDVLHPDAQSLGQMLSSYQPSLEALKQGIDVVLEHLQLVVENARSQGLREVVLLDIGGSNLKPTTIFSRFANIARVFRGEEPVVELSNSVYRKLWQGIAERGYTPVLQRDRDFAVIPGEAFAAAYRIAVRIEQP